MASFMHSGIHKPRITHILTQQMNPSLVSSLSIETTALYKDYPTVDNEIYLVSFKKTAELREGLINDFNEI